jgi:8-oxo-dGTP diphosphatase
MFPLETDRLRLRRLELRDAPSVRTYAGDWDVARYLADVPYPYPHRLAENWICLTQEKLRGGGDYTLAVALRADNALIGTVQVKTGNYAKGAEVGYWIGRPYWCRGYATEAVSRMVLFAFNRMGVHRVWAATLVDNAPSQRVLEKVGMHSLGIEDYDFPARGGIKKVNAFALTREEAKQDDERLGAAVTRI